MHQDVERDAQLVALFSAIRGSHPTEADWIAFEHAVTILIHATALRLSGDFHLSEDITQDVLIAAHRQASGFTFSEGLDVRGQAVHIRAWLVRITSNLTINACKRRARQGGTRQADDDQVIAADPAVANGDDEEIAALRRAIADLPEACRLPVILRFFEGATFREIAAVLDISVGGAKNQVDAALVRMRRQLQGIGYGGVAIIPLLDCLRRVPLEAGTTPGGLSSRPPTGGLPRTARRVGSPRTGRGLRGRVFAGAILVVAAVFGGGLWWARGHGLKTHLAGDTAEASSLRDWRTWVHPEYHPFVERGLILDQITMVPVQRETMSMRWHSRLEDARLRAISDTTLTERKVEVPLDQVFTPGPATPLLLRASERACTRLHLRIADPAGADLGHRVLPDVSPTFAVPVPRRDRLDDPTQPGTVDWTITYLPIGPVFGFLDDRRLRLYELCIQRDATVVFHWWVMGPPEGIRILVEAGAPGVRHIGDAVRETCAVTVPDGA